KEPLLEQDERGRYFITSRWLDYHDREIMHLNDLRRRWSLLTRRATDSIGWSRGRFQEELMDLLGDLNWTLGDYNWAVGNPGAVSFSFTPYQVESWLALEINRYFSRVGQADGVSAPDDDEDYSKFIRDTIATGERLTLGLEGYFAGVEELEREHGDDE
ncbi:MAG: hypothetical protein Q8P59_09760, partial [Dehalococcoidia bacterium]|nr:hypothetical protein [Dehalococcoidia bacterium]